jgi:hypothetical protein
MDILKKFLMNVDVRLFVISSLLVGATRMVFDWRTGLYGLGIFALWYVLMLIIQGVEHYDMLHQRGPIHLEARMSGKKWLEDKENREKEVVIEYSQEEIDSIFNNEDDELPWFKDIEDPTKF